MPHLICLHIDVDMHAIDLLCIVHALLYTCYFFLPPTLATLFINVGMSNTAVGTCKYMSPERLEGLAYNETADIYAFGIVMLEIINNNCYPFGKGAGGGSAGGSCASGHCGDAEVDDGGTFSYPTAVVAAIVTDPDSSCMLLYCCVVLLNNIKLLFATTTTGILSPIELLAEFETLSVNKLLDSYILPNINATGGNICITSQLREFITGKPWLLLLPLTM